MAVPGGGAAARGGGSTAARLSVAVIADLKGLTKGLGAVTDQITGLGKTLALVGVGVGAGIAASMLPAVKMAGDLQQAVANISTIKPEIDTTAVFQSLNEMSAKMGQPAEELASSLYNVFSSIDVSQSGALQLVETFAKGAKGAATDAETFGTAVLGVMNAYKLSVEDAAHISDVFFNTVNLGVVTGQELASSLGPVTQAAKAAGVSLDELGGFIAGVTKEGGPAAQNINNLTNLFNKITTVAAQEELNNLGIATKDVEGNFRPALDVLADLKSRLSTMASGEATEWVQKVFPDMQARQGAQTIMSQLDFVRTAIDRNATSAGAAEAAFTKMNSTFNSQLEILKQTANSTMTEIGAKVLPYLTPVVTTIGQKLPGAIDTLIQKLTPLGVIALQVLKGDFGGALEGLKVILASVLAWLLPRLQALGAAAWQWITTVAIPGIKGALPGILATIQEWASGALRWLLGIGSNLAQSLISGILERFPALGQAIAFLKPYFDQMITAFANLWGVIQRNLSPALAAIKPLFDELAPIIGGALVGAVAGAMVFFKSLANTLANVLPTGIEIARRVVIVLVEAIEGIKAIVGGTVETIGKLLKGDWAGAWDGAVKVVNATLNAIGDTLVAFISQIIPNWRGAWEMLGAIVFGVTETIGQAVNNIVNAIGMLASGAGTVLERLLAGDFAGAWEAAKVLATDGLASVGGVVSDSMSAMAGSIGNAIGQIDDVWAEGWRQLGTTTASGVPGVVGPVVGAMALPPSAAAEMADKTATEVDDMIARLRASMQDDLPDALNMDALLAQLGIDLDAFSGDVGAALDAAAVSVDGMTADAAVALESVWAPAWEAAAEPVVTAAEEITTTTEEIKTALEGAALEVSNFINSVGATAISNLVAWLDSGTLSVDFAASEINSLLSRIPDAVLENITVFEDFSIALWDLAPEWQVMLQPMVDAVNRMDQETRNALELNNIPAWRRWRDAAGDAANEMADEVSEAVDRTLDAIRNLSNAMGGSDIPGLGTPSANQKGNELAQVGSRYSTDKANLQRNIDAILRDLRMTHTPSETRSLQSNLAQQRAKLAELERWYREQQIRLRQPNAYNSTSLRMQPYDRSQPQGARSTSPYDKSLITGDTRPKSVVIYGNVYQQTTQVGDGGLNMLSRLGT